MRSKYFFFFLFLFILPSVIAKQPIQQSELGANFLVLETGLPEYHKLGDDFYLHTHVYDGNNSHLRTDVSCYYHSYNHQIDGGQHISVGNLTQYGAGYFVLLNGSLFNETGQYSHLMWCNDSSKGGFFEYSFEVTESGQAFQNVQLHHYLLFFMIIFLLGFIAFRVKIKYVTIPALILMNIEILVVLMFFKADYILKDVSTLIEIHNLASYWLIFGIVGLLIFFFFSDKFDIDKDEKGGKWDE